MKKIILSLFAIMATLSIDAQTTTEINVIRIYSSERTGDDASYPVAEYQNSTTDKYRAELKNEIINIYKNNEATAINSFTNDGDVKYRVELQKIKVTVDGKDANDREYVNLGSGTLWAKTNVGGTLETDYGKYYAWGEVTAANEVPNQYPTSVTGDWTSNTSEDYLELIDNTTFKKNYLYATYKWCSNAVNENRPSSNTLSKYLSSSHYTLEDVDDAAKENWDSNWSMPTSTQIEELIDNTYNYSLYLNGIWGYRFVKNGDTSRYIFFPAASFIGQTGIDGEDYSDYLGYVGTYWANNLNSKHYAYNLYFSNLYEPYLDDENIRPLGCPVRAVYSK